MEQIDLLCWQSFFFVLRAKTRTHLANEVEELTHHKRPLEELLVRGFTVFLNIHSTYPLTSSSSLLDNLSYAKRIIHVTLQN